jgi:hypothetical protein
MKNEPSKFKNKAILQRDYGIRVVSARLPLGAARFFYGCLGAEHGNIFL